MLVRHFSENSLEVIQAKQFSITSFKYFVLFHLPYLLVKPFCFLCTLAVCSSFNLLPFNLNIIPTLTKCEPLSLFLYRPFSVCVCSSYNRDDLALALVSNHFALFPLLNAPVLQNFFSLLFLLIWQACHGCQSHAPTRLADNTFQASQGSILHLELDRPVVTGHLIYMISCKKVGHCCINSRYDL